MAQFSPETARAAETIVLDEVPAKVRVHVLAKTIGVTSKDLIAALAATGVEGKVASSSVTRDQVEALVAAARAQGGSGDGAGSAATGEGTTTRAAATRRTSDGAKAAKGTKATKSTKAAKSTKRTAGATSAKASTGAEAAQDTGEAVSPENAENAANAGSAVNEAKAEPAKKTRATKSTKRTAGAKSSKATKATKATTAGKASSTKDGAATRKATKATKTTKAATTTEPAAADDAATSGRSGTPAPDAASSEMPVFLPPSEDAAGTTAGAATAATAAAADPGETAADTQTDADASGAEQSGGQRSSRRRPRRRTTKRTTAAETSAEAPEAPDADGAPARQASAGTAEASDSRDDTRENTHDDTHDDAREDAGTDPATGTGAPRRRRVRRIIRRVGAARVSDEAGADDAGSTDRARGGNRSDDRDGDAGQAEDGRNRRGGRGRGRGRGGDRGSAASTPSRTQDDDRQESPKESAKETSRGSRKGRQKDQGNQGKDQGNQGKDHGSNGKDHGNQGGNGKDQGKDSKDHGSNGKDGKDQGGRTVEVVDEPVKLKGSTRLESKRRWRQEQDNETPRPISRAEFRARRELVHRSLVVRDSERTDHAGTTTQVGVTENGMLVEHFVTSETQQSIVGNIYLGRVQNVLASMEAAFIDIGTGRNAVLYAGEVDWRSEYLHSRHRRIDAALKQGDQILVQVIKDPVGHKGARLTNRISFAGRFLVYLPGGTSAGISRRLPEGERKRLKEVLKRVIPGDGGAIIRTAAEGVSEEMIGEDVTALHDRWLEIRAREKKARSRRGSTPETMYEEPNMLVKVIRDIFNEGFNELVVDGDASWSVVQSYVHRMAPDLEDRLVRWNRRQHGGQDVFAAKELDAQLEKALSRKVWLPSGGHLIFDRTEAMTVVDVNTGSFTGAGGNLEQTVTENNLEAAEEIVRQIRLRDIGGMIVVDFIDMVLEENQDLVLRRLTEHLSRDRTRHNVSEVTSLGLVQMTRKRLGTGLLEAFSTPCEACDGRGLVIHPDPVEPEEDDGDRRRDHGGREGRRQAQREQERAEEIRKRTADEVRRAHEAEESGEDDDAATATAAAGAGRGRGRGDDGARSGRDAGADGTAGTADDSGDDGSGRGRSRRGRRGSGRRTVSAARRSEQSGVSGATRRSRSADADGRADADADVRADTGAETGAEASAASSRGAGSSGDRPTVVRRRRIVRRGTGLAAAGRPTRTGRPRRTDDADVAEIAAEALRRAAAEDPDEPTGENYVPEDVLRGGGDPAASGAGTRAGAGDAEATGDSTGDAAGDSAGDGHRRSRRTRRVVRKTTGSGNATGATGAKSAGKTGKTGKTGNAKDTGNATGGRKTGNDGNAKKTGNAGNAKGRADGAAREAGTRRGGGTDRDARAAYEEARREFEASPRRRRSVRGNSRSDVAPTPADFGVTPEDGAPSGGPSGGSGRGDAPARGGRRGGAADRDATPDDRDTGAGRSGGGRSSGRSRRRRVVRRNG
ncbi:translation initiation factor IF-2 N-terminal domain-containing protein [Corynebacterium bovis]|uniref:translation initiation factor IF-2 N-terminal domain-containing protein n=2 Tax=Corynebacterium bovis TaxID=36808 RepID=UPI002650E7E2|nr:translation initiation factor IF-2 N-terminal domain-containing protein [Corynebacterium bovis]MDN8578510.1 translation initiation factor IF-2 N-terminal domain-containing protein [Corynebacterium bovis]